MFLKVVCGWFCPLTGWVCRLRLRNNVEIVFANLDPFAKNSIAQDHNTKKFPGRFGSWHRWVHEDSLRGSGPTTFQTIWTRILPKEAEFWGLGMAQARSPSHLNPFHHAYPLRPRKPRAGAACGAL